MPKQVKAEESQYKIKFYSIAAPWAPVNVAAKKLSDYLKKRSEGKVELVMFTAGQLGAESAAMNQLQLGTLQTAAITGVAISTIEPKANVFMLPFVFNNYDDVKKFARSDLILELDRSLQKKNLRIMGVTTYGFFNILSTKKFIIAPDDFKGIKIRVYPTPILTDMYKLLGACPTPVAFTEVYTALQQGVVEATDGTFDSAYASKQYEVAKYLTMTKHVVGWFLYLANKQWFDSLPEEIKRILSEGFELYSEVATNESENFERETAELFKKKGVKIKELSKSEREVLSKALYPLHEKYRSRIGGDFLKRFYEATGFVKP